MTVKHWNTGASAVRFRDQAGKRASERDKIKKLLKKIYPYHHTIQLGSWKISWYKKTGWSSLEIKKKGIYIIY